MELTVNFDSLANISPWSKAWWKIAWEMLDESGGLERNDFDSVWAFLVRHCLSGEINPTLVAEVICEFLDWGWNSQFIHRV